MNSPRFLLVLILVAANSSAIALWQARAARRADAAFTALAEKQVDAERRVQGSEARLRNADAIHSELAKELAASSSALAGLGSAPLSSKNHGAENENTPDPTDIVFVSRAASTVTIREMVTSEVAIDEPTVIKTLEVRAAEFDSKYGGIASALGLSPALRGQLFTLVGQYESETANLTLKAQEQASPAEGAAILAARDQMLAQHSTALRELLGEEKARQWQDYERALPGLEKMGDWMGGAALAGVPVEFPQLVQLGHALQARPANASSGETDWRAVAATARSILTAEQFAYVEPHLRAKALAQKRDALLSEAERALDPSAANPPAR